MSRIEEALRRAGQNPVPGLPAEHQRPDVSAGAAAATLDAADGCLPLYRSEAPREPFDFAGPDDVASDAPAPGDLPRVHDPVDAYAPEPAPEARVAPAPAPAPDLRVAPAPAAAPEARVPPAPAAAPESRAAAPAGGFAYEKLIVNTKVEPVAVEQYRKLAVTLHQMQAERGTKTVMIASAMAAEGKTLTASNLALTLSESLKRRVLLVDADMRRPSVHEVFKIPNTGGLGAALGAIGDEKLRVVEVSPHLTILPAGRPDPNPMSGLTSDRMRRILAEASAKFDWVVIDTPPIGLLPDANILAEMADTVVLVIGAGMTPFKPIQRAVEALGRNRIAGVVLNRVAGFEPAYSYYAHYHYTRQRETEPAPGRP